MPGKSSKIGSVLFYVALFSLSFLVFDSITLIIGVLVAVFALHHFSSRWASKGYARKSIHDG